MIYVSAAALSSVAGHIVRRHGAAMTSLAALAFCALGLAGLASGRMVPAILGSLSIGCAYGLTNPAASHLLLRFAPRRRQNLIFALKQTGVPLGAMLAALMLPALAKAYEWQTALLAGALLVVLLAVPLALVRRRLDDDREPGARLRGGLLHSLRVVTANPALRALGVMGMAYASFQFCLFTFLITMLVEDFGWDLVAAGGIATLMQIGGATGRIAWSVLADRIGRGLEVLLGIGLASAAAALTLAMATPAWPVPLLTLLLVAFGFCLVGWNGLWMAEIARASSPGEVSLATGGVLVFTYVGVVLGPASFAYAYTRLGSYALTYGVFAVLSLVGVLALATAIRHRNRITTSSPSALPRSAANR